MYTCDLLSCRELAQIVKRNLGQIGIDVEIEVLPIPSLLARLGRPGEPFDLAVYGHAGDVADPGAFLGQMLALPALEVGSFGPRLAAADRLAGRDRQRALGRLANELAREEAPVVAFASPVRQDLFSARIGCQVFNPLYGIDLAALCIRR
jgi:ABC-type transport system substrate-binding protein